MVSSSTTPTTLDVTVTVLTAPFQIRGQARINMALQAFFNDTTRPTFSIFNANVLGVSVSNPAATMSQPEMIVHKRACHAIIVEGNPPAGSFSYPSTNVQLVAYTEQYAILGKYPIAADQRVTDFIELAQTPFIPVLEARIFGLFQGRPGLSTAASVALLHRSNILTYHRA